MTLTKNLKNKSFFFFFIGPKNERIRPSFHRRNNNNNKHAFRERDEKRERIRE